jgi:acetyl-CoA acyltransferase
MNLGRNSGDGSGSSDFRFRMTVNRFCASGLQAIADATAKIRRRMVEIIIAGGCEP